MTTDQPRRAITRRAVLSGLMATGTAGVLAAFGAPAKAEPSLIPPGIIPPGLIPAGLLPPGILSPEYVAPDPASIAARHAGQTPGQWGMALPGIATRFLTDRKQISLTLDACSGAIDEGLLRTLETNRVPATLFLNGKWIDANPGVTERLAANPLFDIGNHGTRHVPLSVSGKSAYGIAGTSSAQQVVDEVWGNHQRLTALTGRPPTWFRPGTAHYDDVAVAIVTELGEHPLGFTVNADGGATFSPTQVRMSLIGPPNGSIIIAHMNRPSSGTSAGMASAIPALIAAGYEFVPLHGRTMA